jgi:VanZ family protein
MKRFCWYQLPAILWAIAIFIESSLSNLKTPSLGIDFSDKLAHAFVFGILGWLTTRAFEYSRSDTLRARAILISIIVGSVYGMLDELHQYFVPGRQCDVLDWLADIIGVLAAQLPFSKMASIFKRQNPKRSVPEN